MAVSGQPGVAAFVVRGPFHVPAGLSFVAQPAVQTVARACTGAGAASSAAPASNTGANKPLDAKNLPRIGRKRS